MGRPKGGNIVERSMSLSSTIAWKNGEVPSELGEH